MAATAPAQTPSAANCLVRDCGGSAGALKSLYTAAQKGQKERTGAPPSIARVGVIALPQQRQVSRSFAWWRPPSILGVLLPGTRPAPTPCVGETVGRQTKTTFWACPARTGSNCTKSPTISTSVPGFVAKKANSAPPSVQTILPPTRLTPRAHMVPCTALPSD